MTARRRLAGPSDLKAVRPAPRRSTGRRRTAADWRPLAGDERGSATVVGVGAVLAVLTAFVLAVHLGAAVVTRHRAEAAADLAALAAAAHAVDGPTACDHARRVTDRMSTRLLSCELTGWEVDVRVEAAPPGPLARFGMARAAARAGPALAGSAADGR